MDRADLQKTTAEVIGPKLGDLRKLAGAMILGGLILCAISLLAVFAVPGAQPQAERLRNFFAAYLYGYLFWFGVTTGSLGLLMLHHVTGGAWGFVIRRFLEAGSSVRQLLLVAALFIPVVIGMWFFGLYPWTTHADHPFVTSKAWYLNPVSFLIRAGILFGIWIWMSSYFQSRGAIQYERDDPATAERLNVWAARGLVLFSLTITLMAVDWVMSLTMAWLSSIIGLLFLASQALSTLALLLFLAGYLGGDRPLVQAVPKGYWRDLGNLTLAVVMLWAYMSFSQYLITYSGNQVEEIVWYTARKAGGWVYIGAMLVILHFFAPFGVLLWGGPNQGDWKKNPRTLSMIALFLIAMRFVDLYFWVIPSFRGSLWPFTAAEFGTPLLIGGIWLLSWQGQVGDRPVVPVYDPRVEAHWHEVAEHHA